MIHVAETTASHALREATAALLIGRASCRTPGGTEADGRALATDVARTLEAVVELLRTAGVDTPTDPSGDSLEALARAVSSAVTTARRAAGTDERPAAPARERATAPDD